jgi:Flp pilus assembly protein TadG
MSRLSAWARRRVEASPGQALVEFSLILIPFMVLMMGIFDLGRGIYMMNGTAEAAREIARVTSVHPYTTCCDLGSSAKAQAVVNTQRALIPSLSIAPSTDITCVDITDAVIPDNQCRAGHFVKVRVRATFTPITPLVSMFGSHTFESFSRIKYP